MKRYAGFWILRQIRRRIPAILVMTFAQVGHSLLCVLFALGSCGVIDSAIAGVAEDFVNASMIQALIISGILLCLTIVRHLRDRLHADLERDWKKRLLHGLIHGEYVRISEYHSGELINRLNNDVNKVNEGLLTVIPSAAAMVTRLVAAIVVMSALDAWFMLLILCCGSVVLLATGLIRKKLKVLNKEVSDHDGKISGFLQEILEKLIIVQTMDIGNEVDRRADLLLEKRYAVQRKRKNVGLLANTGVNFMALGAGFLALVWCGYRMLLGQMTAGSLTAVIHLVNQLQMPFTNLSGIVPQYIAMIASAERLMELDEIQGEQEGNLTNPDELYERMNGIEAQNITFSFDRNKLLSEATFAVPKGVFAVITGPSGIGKSTILKLLLGVFTPEAGTLCLTCDDERVTISRATRRMFAYVPQGNLLFSGTLRDNLLIAAPEASEEEIQKAIHISAIDEYLMDLPKGLDTELGENGMGLSEGQGQRVAIARAILGGAPILLLDECTSALDPETEEKVLHRLRDVPGRTCITVTHRPAAVNLCDFHLEVKNGKICLKKQV